MPSIELQGYRHSKISLINFAWHRAILECSLQRKLQTEEYVDHIDGNRSNNTIKNLRIATARMNAQNRKRSGENHGISYYKSRKKWRVKINDNDGKQVTSIKDAAGKAIPLEYVNVEEARKCRKYLEEYFGGAYRHKLILDTFYELNKLSYF